MPIHLDKEYYKNKKIRTEYPIGSTDEEIYPVQEIVPKKGYELPFAVPESAVEIVPKQKTENKPTVKNKKASLTKAVRQKQKKTRIFKKEILPFAVASFFLLCGYLIVNSDYSDHYYSYSYGSDTPYNEQIDSIKVVNFETNVYLHKASGDDIEIIASEHMLDKYHIKISNNELMILKNSTSVKYDAKRGNLDIYIPESFDGQINLAVRNSSINCELDCPADLKIVEPHQRDSFVGLSVKNSRLNSLESNNSADLYIIDSDFAEDLDAYGQLKHWSSNVVLQNVTSGGSITISAGDRDLKAENCTAEEYFEADGNEETDIVNCGGKLDEERKLRKKALEQELEWRRQMFEESQKKVYFEYKP